MTKKYLPAIGAFLAGSVSVLSLPPYGWWPLLFVGLSAFYWLVRDTQSAKTIFIRSWLFGFGYFLFGLSWIGNALLVDGNPYAWAWPLAVAGLPFMLAFFIAIPMAFLPKLKGFFSFVALLSLSEILRGHLFTGFPWNLFAYAWSDHLPIAQLSALGGAYFLSLVTIFWAASPAWIATLPRWRITTGCMVIASFALVWAGGLYRLHHNETRYHDDIRLKIVQPNIQQDMKWDTDSMVRNTLTHIDLSRPTTTPEQKTVIIWPETALTDTMLNHPQIQKGFETLFAAYDGQAALLTGMLRRDEQGYYNSLVALDAQLSMHNIFDKAHLVPFGEYIPFQDYIPLQPVVQFEGFRPGAGLQSFPLIGDISYSPLVCYEIIFPGKSLPRDGADFIVNVTNDAWYGQSAGPYQHFMHARFRAIEEGRPVIRSANTGISGLIDPVGRILTQTRLDESAAPEKLLPLPTAAATPFSRYGFLIFWLLWLAFLTYPFGQGLCKKAFRSR